GRPSSAFRRSCAAPSKPRGCCPSRSDETVGPRTMNASDPVAAALHRGRSGSVPGQGLPVGARVALHCHPEADASGTGVLASILDRGQYVSQFVTGTSNGGLTAYPGGDRWNWEQRIFGGAYDHAQAQHRPVYGALDLDGDPYGPAPRFRV